MGRKGEDDEAAQTFPTALEPGNPKSTGKMSLFLDHKALVQRSSGGDSALLKVRYGQNGSEGTELIDARSGKSIGVLFRKGGCYCGWNNHRVCFGSEDREDTGMLKGSHSNAKIFVGDAVVGKTKGGIRCKKFQIYLNGTHVATAYRKQKQRLIRVPRVEFMIDVEEAGVDLAFLSLICFGLDCFASNFKRR